MELLTVKIFTLKHLADNQISLHIAQQVKYVPISLVAHFNFFPNLFSCSISDKDIVRQSRFLDNLKAGDFIMEHKGFNIF